MLLGVSRANPSVNAKCKGRRLFLHFEFSPHPRRQQRRRGSHMLPYITLFLTRGLDLVQAQEVRHLAWLGGKFG